MDLRRVEANGLTFNVALEGAGPPVLLLHGFPDSWRLWRHQIPVLAAAGYRVVAPDLRGFGDSDRPEGAENYAVPHLLGDVLGILDALEIGGTAVVAHDWGGFLGWVLAASAPERVTRLAALTVGHPAAYGAAGIRQRELSWYMLFFQYVGVAEDVLRRDDWAFLRMWVGREGPDLEESLALLARPGALTAGLNWYRANTSPEFYVGAATRVVPPVGCPVLGVWASGDRFLTEEFMTASAAHVTGPWRYERLEGVDHWIPTSAPEACNRLLLEFLAEEPR